MEGCVYATGVGASALAGAAVSFFAPPPTRETAVFTRLPDRLRRAAAGGLALVVSIGNPGGFVGPYVIGETTGSFERTPTAVAGCLLAGAILIRFVGRNVYSAPINRQTDAMAT